MNVHDFPELFRYQFWHRFRLHFGVLFHVFSCSIFERIFDGISNGFWTKMAPKMLCSGLPLGTLFRSYSAGGVFEGPLAYFGSLSAPFLVVYGSCFINFGIDFEGPLAHFGSLLAPCWLFLAVFSLNFGIEIFAKSELFQSHPEFKHLKKSFTTFQQLHVEFNCVPFSKLFSMPFREAQSSVNCSKHRAKSLLLLLGASLQRIEFPALLDMFSGTVPF
jgi:hypothetical protein